LDISLLNSLLDVVMIIAIVGLWVMWFKQSAQRKKVELMLQQASEELQEATTLLDNVMTQLPQLQKSEQQHSHHQQLIQDSATQDKVSIQRRQQPKAASTQAPAPTPQPRNRPSIKRSQAKPAQQQDGANQSAQIMRLNREGLSMESIAEQLDMPIAQVRLMLLLQAPKT